MATVSDILVGKGRHLNTISAPATVYDAAIMMNEHKIGSLLVLESSRLIGILTERDILVHVVAQQRDASQTLVGDIMTRDVVCCTPQTDVEEARCVMRDRRIRHLPVINGDGEVIGLISIGDLNAFQAQNQERTIYQLQGYIHGTW